MNRLEVTSPEAIAHEIEHNCSRPMHVLAIWNPGRRMTHDDGTLLIMASSYTAVTCVYGSLVVEESSPFSCHCEHKHRAHTGSLGRVARGRQGLKCGEILQDACSVYQYYKQYAPLARLLNHADNCWYD